MCLPVSVKVYLPVFFFTCLVIFYLFDNIFVCFFFAKKGRCGFACDVDFLPLMRICLYQLEVDQMLVFCKEREMWRCHTMLCNSQWRNGYAPVALYGYDVI